MSDTTSRDAEYEMGVRHGYEIAVAELTHILQERMNAGEDILPLLPLVDELRSRAHDAHPALAEYRKQVKR